MGETLTIPFDSLPLGFRFHPKDDELINHYLKRKIDGRIKPCDAAVIPEIDVCKFEPWDLPERSPIRSLDQEWFFFAPVDRKYPSGNRWNRATGAGYWKATGKDRLIRSRGAGGATMLVGMKKTLVFHQGRAPKGVRTNWIMHEYRTVEPEFDCSGDQGGFVLCRLFRKSEETLPCSSSNVMERSGLSPTPNSSPNSILNEGEGLEESATPLDRSPDIDLLEELQPLPDNTIEQSVEKTAVNESENLIPHPLKLEESHFHRNLTSDACDYEGEILREEGPLFDYLAPFLGPEYAHLFSDELPQKSLMQSSVDYPTHGDMKSKMHEQDSVTELLDAIVCTPEEYSAEASNSQADSASKLMPDNQTSMINHDPLLIAHGGITHLQASEQSCRLPFPSNALQIDPSDIYNETNPMRYALAENSDPSLLCPHPSMESPVDLFINNSQSRMLESNINIRYRPPLNSESSVNSEQGLAERRIRLQILKHVEGEGRVVTRNDKKGSTSKATEEDDKPFKNETAFVGDLRSSSVDDTLTSLRLTKQTNDAGNKLEGSYFSQVICRVGSVSLRQMSVVMLVNVFMFCVGTWFFNSYRG